MATQDKLQGENEDYSSPSTLLLVTALQKEQCNGQKSNETYKRAPRGRSRPRILCRTKNCQSNEEEQNCDTTTSDQAETAGSVTPNPRMKAFTSKLRGMA